MIDDPYRIIEDFGVQEGSMVADLGVGYGHYAYALSHIIGDRGRVFAVDVQKNLLDRLKKETLEKGIHNLEIIWGDIEVIGGTKLRAESVDIVVMVNTLFQLDSKPGVMHEIARILKIGGRLLLIDWSESFGEVGPQPNMVVDEVTAQRLFETGPFLLKRKINAGEHHYGLVFERKAS
jgi:ubiquinone/menaquinone biosynthesis C-methylase UbiE